MNLFYYRSIGILKLYPKAFADIAKNPSTAIQSLLILGLSVLSTGIALSGGYHDRIAESVFQASLAWLVLPILVSLSAILLRRTAAPLSHFAILRLLAFASAPGIFRGIAFFAPFSAIVNMGTSLWNIATLVICLQLIHPKKKMLPLIIFAILSSACYQYLLLGL